MNNNPNTTPNLITQLPLVDTISNEDMPVDMDDTNYCERIGQNSSTETIDNNYTDTSGEDFGYTDTNLGNNCYEESFPIYESLPTHQLPIKLPNKFKIVTWNIWGLIKDTTTVLGTDNLGGSFVDLRMKRIAKILVESKADIICCQEVSGEALSYLYGDDNEVARQLRKHYPYCSEPELLKSDILRESRGHNVEVMLFSKYKPTRYTIYQLAGNLTFTNSMFIAEFENVRVSSVYLQPGCRFSPGQAKHWAHYARCRQQQLERVGDHIRETVLRYGKKPMILTGDFNFHLSGSIQDWPEKGALHSDQNLGQLGLEDIWLREYPDDATTPGYTENTDVNDMRWNSKFKTKMFRYDGILVSRNLESSQAGMIGTDGFYLSEAQTKTYEVAIKKIDPTLQQLRYADNSLLQWFPSDHFGVSVNLQFKSVETSEEN
jgi:endonuclease/exonuclease/phosphatase family metal-dependent hydrolase